MTGAIVVLATLAPLAACRPSEGDLCRDVHAVRTCWSSTAGASVVGTAAATTEPRIVQASPFRCAGERCIQRYPRMPDDGEWECTDLSGAVLCRGGIPAAGVSASPPDGRWVCGERRADAGPLGRALCVDFSPDLPRPGESWECRFDYTPSRPERVCVRATRPQLGDACDRDGACPLGARCRSRRCLPPLPRPSCWLDGDCARGRCAFGTCETDG